MRQFLKKFLSSSFLAGTVFIFSKTIGIWLGLYITGATFTLNISDSLNNMIVVSSSAQIEEIVLYSNLVFIVLIIVAATLILSKTIIFNDLTRSPRVLVKVIHLNLSGWLEDGHSMYPKLFAWNIFLWMGTLLVVKDFLSNNLPIYLPLSIGIFSAFFTYKVFNFLDSHITDMISYIYDTKTK